MRVAPGRTSAMSGARSTSVKAGAKRPVGEVGVEFMGAILGAPRRVI
jgi:hypothetical protein